MRIDAYATRSHFLEHLLPVWRALPEEARGRLMVPSRRLAALAPDAERAVPDADGPLLLVASHEDLDGASRKRRTIYLEHGAGQTYGGDRRAGAHPAYSGGRHRDRVALFLVPNERAAELNRAAYPDVPSVVVGCPRLDGQAALPEQGWRLGLRPRVLGITFHWDCHLCPETRSALPAWKPMLRRIAEEWPGPVLGHAHPRLYAQLAPWLKRCGIEPVPDVGRFLESIDVLAWDNTSTGYEAAALGIPTVVLNAPWYRREVEHGLRFWEAIPGPELDPTGDGHRDAEGLVLAAIMAEAAHWRSHSASVASAVYPPETRGRAASLAAAAILALEC